MASGAAAAVQSNQHQSLLPPQPQVQRFKYSKRVVLKSIVDREDKGLQLEGHRVVVGGWVKSRKERAEQEDPATPTPLASAPQGAQEVSCCEALVQRLPFLRHIARILIPRIPTQAEETTANDGRPVSVYLRINDGSCTANLQVVIDSSMSLPGQVIGVGSSILVEGVLQEVSSLKRDAVELKVEKILHVGVTNLKKYPLAKPKVPLEFLRTYPHLRPRSITVGSITRIRSNLTNASHAFFQKSGFIHVHMPIITSTNAGYHGKMLQVTIISKAVVKDKQAAADGNESVNLETVKAAIKEKSKRIDVLQRTDSNKEALLAAEQDLGKAKELALLLEKQRKPAPLDFSNDFFSHPVYLSVSAGLHLESYACALSSVYTIGPVFQAEESSPSKNLAEMWMVEVELAFAELEDVMNCAEDLLKFLCHSLLDNSIDDLKYVSKTRDKHSIKRLKSVTSNPFARITYSAALDILNQVKDKSFKAKVEWGISLSEEHERYLADEVYKMPIIIYEYPKEIKPFYAHVRDDGRTVSAFDIIAPKVGVLVRGSQKEERIDVISKRIQEIGLPHEQYDWYMDLRKYGSVKRSGFSLGFEKMVMFATGLTDAKDAIPFPRTHGDAKL